MKTARKKTKVTLLNGVAIPTWFWVVAWGRKNNLKMYYVERRFDVARRRHWTGTRHEWQGPIKDLRYHK